MLSKKFLPLIGFVLIIGIVVIYFASQSNKQITDQAMGSSGNAPPTAVAADLLKQAEQLYAQRSDFVKLREAIKLLKNAKAAEPSNYEVAWRLSQYGYFLAMHTEDKDEKKQAFNDGTAAARSAIKLQENKPEGHFWLAANLGGRAQQSPLSGLTDIDEIRKSLETVIKIDEQYQGGSAYMALGQLELETSGMFMGGDKKKALEYLEKGLRFGFENSMLRLRLAEAYIANDRKEDARKQIDYILKMKPNPDYLPEYNDTVKEANELLEQLK
jgi:tetratricopeptide (TPR) repeat protein